MPDLSTRSWRNATLAALALPILGMAGLFAWSGVQTEPASPVALVEQFVTAYNGGNCQLLRVDVVHPSATCSAKGLSAALSCTEHLVHARAADVPAGYTDGEVVRLRCAEGTSGARLSANVSVAMDESTGAEKITAIEEAP